MILVKNLQFSIFFVLVEIGKKHVFYDILERKNAFVDNKNNKSKKWKKCIFPKELVLGFDQKLAILLSFYFKQNRTA